MDNRVVHFEIQADDVERAKKFYEAVLGWKISQIMSKEKSGMMDYWGVETGTTNPGINGGLYQRPPKESDQHRVYDCTVAVADINKAMEAVKANGGQILREKSEIPGVGFFSRAKDTEGNLFGLMQPTEWKPK